MALTSGRRRQIDRYDGSFVIVIPIISSISTFILELFRLIELTVPNTLPAATFAHFELGQTIFIGNQVAYELGNYLGGGASGSVYQALDVSSQNPQEKSVAIKILKPLGYKILPYGQLAKCIVASKGQPLNQKQIHGKAPLTAENLWWLVHSSSEHVYAAYEDASRGQLRELTLPRCIEIWGWAPLGSDRLPPEIVEKKNLSGHSFVVSNTSVIQLPTVAPKYLRWLQSRATICREMNNMIHIGEHPNIVDLLEVLELIQDSKAVLFLVLEFVNGGELFDRMKRSSGPGTPSDEFARRYFSQLLSGIDYCHCKGVVHRDLKPENLLLSDPSESAILKIADFGLSAVVFATEGVDAAPSYASPFALPSSNYLTSPGGNDRDLDYLTVTGNDSEGQHVHFNMPNSPIQILHSPLATHKQHSQSLPTNTPSPVPLRRLRSVVGSPHYIAPEIVNLEDPCGYDGRKVDMWSAGVILYSLLTGSLPFGGDLSSCPRYKVYKQWMLSEYGPAVREGRLKDLVLPVWFFPPCISTLAGSLILQLIHVDPLQRCTAAEALRHPWSTGEGAKPAVTDLNISSSRSQLKGVKLLQPDDSTLPCNPLTDKDREKAKASKGSHREVKDKRASAPPSPVVTVPAAISPQSAVRSGKPLRSHSSVTLSVPTASQNVNNASSGTSSPTLVSLTSVATVLASFTADTGRHMDLEIEEIVITEETICSSQHSPLLMEESRGLLLEAATAISRLDTTAQITVVEGTSTSQVAARSRVTQASCQQPASTCSYGEVVVSATVVATLPASASSQNPPKFSGRPSSASNESTRSRDRSDIQPSQNQSQPPANTAAYLRGEQCRQGQEREEEERKERERYQSILEQQRQKEAAALAMDPQADQTHSSYATATVQTHPNREPAPLRDSGRLTNPNSMFVHNENDHVASETHEAPPPNQRIHISAASENLAASGNTYIVGENNNYNCDQHK